MAVHTEKSKRMAAYLKDLGIERTTGICAACYRPIKIDSIYGRYTHICKGGKG